MLPALGVQIAEWPWRIAEWEERQRGQEVHSLSRRTHAHLRPAKQAPIERLRPPTQCSTLLAGAQPASSACAEVAGKYYKPPDSPISFLRFFAALHQHSLRHPRAHHYLVGRHCRGPPLSPRPCIASRARGVICARTIHQAGCESAFLSLTADQQPEPV